MNIYYQNFFKSITHQLVYVYKYNNYFTRVVTLPLVP